MSSPTVWTDARARIAAAALAPVAWPNEDFTIPEPPAPFLIVEIAGDMAQPIELGGTIWREDGDVIVHTMVPAGTGIAAGLALRKAVANLFRGITAGAVVYREMRFDTLGPADDDGAWRPLTLAVRYVYQDTTAP